MNEWCAYGTYVFSVRWEIQQSRVGHWPGENMRVYRRHPTDSNSIHLHLRSRSDNTGSVGPGAINVLWSRDWSIGKNVHWPKRLRPTRSLVALSPPVQRPSAIFSAQSSC